jgi:hypothetical protein
VASPVAIAVADVIPACTIRGIDIAQVFCRRLLKITDYWLIQAPNRRGGYQLAYMTHGFLRR